MKDDTRLLVTLGVIGIIVGVAKLMADDAPIKLRQAVGRCILHGALGVAAASFVVFIPALTFTGQVGLACVFASLGSSVLEKLFSKWAAK